MNGTSYPRRLMKHSIQWPLLFGLLCLLLTRTLSAGQDFYINNDVVTNPGNIDATNFINNNFFTANYSTPYETTDTLNYTNNGTMIALVGFKFDTASGGVRSMASIFYNPGTVRCGSLQDGGGLGVFGFLPQLIVTATNLVDPGTLDVGLNGLLQLTGQNVDLSYSTLTLEQGSLNNTVFGIIGTGSFGTDTNTEWDPSLALTATSAFSSLPDFFNASPSVPYFLSESPTTNLTIIRSIFLNNSNPNVTAQAYFASTFGNGFANVEWSGVFTNPATGMPLTNYLILNNDYVLGASTNLNLNSGYPNNFTFSTDSTTLAGATPATNGFRNVFFSGAISNVYSYVNVTAVPTSVLPGPSPQNPSGALTNLPARTQISASRELNLALSTITGQNYMSLTCTNQFDGNLGAQIVSPYSDINLGVTNGFLTISNLLQSVIPAWSGTIQAWSTEFFYADTNSGFTVTNDYRVLIVQSSLSPFTSPKIQDLTLHGTNLVVSDQLNIFRNLSIDAQSLTLTTNVGYPFIGAGSPDGELNLESGAILFSSALPNLLWLTNNGTINLANAGHFGGSAPANYQTFINTGLLSDQGSTIYASYFKNGGSIQNGSGNFFLQSQSAMMTGGSITSSGDIAITTGSLVASNVQMQAGRSLTLQVTNLLTDNGTNSQNNWSVGASSLVGLNLPILPAAGDLHGTTISVVASASKNVVNTWAGTDWGVSSIGYFNNAAVGRLILNAVNIPPHSLLTFVGAGARNAMYVDNLFLTNNAATLNAASRTATALSISPNLVIYYKQAYSNGVPVSSTINGWNNNRLLWVNPAILAQTNIVVQPPSGLPNGFNYTVSGVLLPNVYGFATNYNVIVQTTTNLSIPNWVNVYTGTPPFTFTSFSFTNLTQQFYRAKQGW